jgi:hypothetical protein
METGERQKKKKDDEGPKMSDLLMNELRGAGYMTRTRIEEILASCSNSDEALVLKRHLNRVRVNEMKMAVKTMRLENELAILRINNEEYENRIHKLEEELRKEL